MDITPVVERCAAMLARPGRHFVAIVGAPGSGKSTASDAIAAAIGARHPGAVAILPMDGFHYDDAILNARGRRPWKGAPDTFDVGGLIATLDRLRGDEGDVAVPVFDRDLELSRGSARIIGPQARLILVEGNYLLLDRAPWDGLRDAFDLTVMLDVPEAELARRLKARWQGQGLDDPEITRKVEANDLPNGRDMRDHSRTADMILT